MEKMKILIADENGEARKACREALLRAGIRDLDEATNGEEALASLQRQMTAAAGRNDYTELMRLTEAASEAETALEEAYARWETAESECNSLQQEATEQ